MNAGDQMNPASNKAIRRAAAFLALAWATGPLFAGQVELDLNGFRLQQFVSAAKTLGTPFKTVDAGNRVAEAYAVDTDAYMVVGHDKKHPNNISFLQLTGVTTKALPFKGLVLGDPEAKVLAALGTPDLREKIEEPPVTKLAYNDRNYSVEIDAKGRLYSILLLTDADLMTRTDGSDDTWSLFKKAVQSRDFVAVSEWLRPDVEIYKAGKTLSIQRGYAGFIKEPDPLFAAALIGTKDSVLQQLALEEPEEQLRLIEDVGVGRVFKFKNGRVLSEIVFFPYNGRYRVYEISFKPEN
jgi:hypothetical protein